jgi:hypothetical protein
MSRRRVRYKTDYDDYTLSTYEMELRNKYLIRSKPRIAPPNRLASPDFSSLPCDSLNVSRKSKNGLLRVCWIVSMQVSESEHLATSKAENVVGVRRFVQGKKS